MIEKLQNKDIDISKKIRPVFQMSYAVEAKLLNATDFPPLKRRLESFIQSDNDFFGYISKQELAGIIEIKHEKNFIHIHSLVVDPKFFRQGIGKSLMDFILNLFEDKNFMVETGVENKPAIELYKKFDFIEVDQWDTIYGIRKIRFERNLNNNAVYQFQING